MIFLFGKRLKLTLELIELVRNENSNLKNEISFLRESLESEKLERINLNNLILMRAGFLPQEGNNNNKEVKEFKPIGRQTFNWARRRAELESNSKIKSEIVKPMTEEELRNIDNLIERIEK